jgi:hypothetical protein
MTTDPDRPDPARLPCPVAQGGAGSHETRRPRPFRLRSLSLAVAVVAVWLGVVLDPLIGPAVMGLVGGLALGVLLMLGALALCWLGFGFFALGERALAWVRHGLRRPE